MILTESKTVIKRKARDKEIQELWSANYKAGETQITPLAESIAKSKKVSLSTVKRLVKDVSVWVNYESIECPICASTEAEVFTSSKKENLIYDNENARCKKCGHTGYVVVEDSECADIVWDEANN